MGKVSLGTKVGKMLIKKLVLSWRATILFGMHRFFTAHGKNPQQNCVIKEGDGIFFSVLLILIKNLNLATFLKIQALVIVISEGFPCFNQI